MMWWECIRGTADSPAALSSFVLTGEHVWRCCVEEGEAEVLAWPRADGLAVECAVPPGDAHPPTAAGVTGVTWVTGATGTRGAGGVR